MGRDSSLCLGYSLSLFLLLEITKLHIISVFNAINNNSNSNYAAHAREITKLWVIYDNKPRFKRPIGIIG